MKVPSQIPVPRGRKNYLALGVSKNSVGPKKSFETYLRDDRSVELLKSLDSLACLLPKLAAYLKLDFYYLLACFII